MDTVETLHYALLKQTDTKELNLYQAGSEIVFQTVTFSFIFLEPLYIINALIKGISNVPLSNGRPFFENK